MVLWLHGCCAPGLSAGSCPGGTIKQADVVLLGFPLEIPFGNMSNTVRRNDLVYYAYVTVACLVLSFLFHPKLSPLALTSPLPMHTPFPPCVPMCHLQPLLPPMPTLSTTLMHSDDVVRHGVPAPAWAPVLFVSLLPTCVA